MKLFLDTANVAEINEAAGIGPVDGVTTNPTLLAREKGDPRDILKEIAGLVDGPVSAEVVSEKWREIVEEGKELAELAENIVIKIPVTVDGLNAARVLHDSGIKTMMTLIFTPGQALLSARAGADYICPFVGRLDDIGLNGMDLVADIVDILRGYDYPTQVVVASVRGPGHVIDSALIGADAVTAPLKVLHQLVQHPLTTAGIERFLRDWRAVEDKK